VVACLLAYLVAVSVLPSTLARLVWALWTVSFGSVHFYGNVVPTALALSLVSWLFLLGVLNTPTLVASLGAGLTAGTVIVFRQDFGAYNVVGAVIVLAIWHRRWILPYLVGAIIPPAAVFGSLLASGVPMPQLIHSLVWFPLMEYAAARRLPWPPLDPLPGREPVWTYLHHLCDSLRFYFPLMVAASAIVVLFLRRQRLARSDLELLGFFGLMTVLFFNQARVRSDLAHVVPAWLPAFVLFGSVISHVPRRAAIFASAVTAIVFAVAPLVTKATFLAHAVAVSMGGASEFTYSVPRADGIGDDATGQNYEAAINYIRERVPPGEPIYVGNYQHDMTVTSDVLFYFLAERGSGTHYHELIPGLTTRLDVQRVMVEDLERTGVRYIVLRDERLALEASNSSSRSSGVQLLDRYIREHFEPVAEFKDYVIARRRP
jgi:hypothetical protein